MGELPPHERAADYDEPTNSATAPPAKPTGDDPEGEGFSTTEKLLGAAAVYKAPFLSSIAASAMLHDETNPVRREQLMKFRSAVIIWMGVGVLVFIIGLIIIASIASRAVRWRAVQGRSRALECRGGAIREYGRRALDRYRALLAGRSD